MRSIANKVHLRARERLAASTPLRGRLIRVGKSYSNFPGLEQFERECLDWWKPHSKQELLHSKIDVRHIAAIAGRRGGKTAWGGNEFCRRIARDYENFKAAGGNWEPPSKITKDTEPALHYWIVAPTYDLAIYPTQAVFKALGGQDSDLILSYVPSRGGGDLWLVGGIKIVIKSAEYPKRLVGSGLSGVWIDEAARIKADVWDDNLSATLNDKQGWAIFTSTPLGQNWLYQDIWQLTQHGVGDPEYFGLNWYTSDNTALPHLASEMEKARKRLAPAVFRRNYMADFFAFVGKVFESFVDDDMHIVDRIPRGAFLHTWGGIDWGFSNPGAAICFGATAAGDIYAWAEDYTSRLTVSPPPQKPYADCWLQRFKRRDLPHWWADPSLPGHLQTCREAGVLVSAADNAILPGIDLVTTLLQPVELRPGFTRPSLRIHRSCRNLRRELVSYTYDDKTGKPVKENDHAVDGFRYGLYSEFRRGVGLGAKVIELEREFPSIFEQAA